MITSENGSDQLGLLGNNNNKKSSSNVFNNIDIPNNQDEDVSRINNNSDILGDKFAETDMILKLKTDLLNKGDPHKRIPSRILEDIKYERSGANGIFEAQPMVVKFCGFELNKPQKLKVQILNKSKFSQRCSIIPPTTPFFNIKFTKKGNIAPGLSESIVITFSPGAYQYYYDYIRILCEGEKFIIPIHAYPKMNIHMKEYLPRYLDLGNVAINQVENRYLVLRNIITAAFEFELVPLKPCSSITVEQVVGTVEPLSNKTICFKFRPNAYGTFMAEYEFRLSEFEFKPVILSVSGTCNVYDVPNNTNMIKYMKKFKEDPQQLSSPNDPKYSGGSGNKGNFLPASLNSNGEPLEEISELNNENEIMGTEDNNHNNNRSSINLEGGHNNNILSSSSNNNLIEGSNDNTNHGPLSSTTTLKKQISMIKEGGVTTNTISPHNHNNGSSLISLNSPLQQQSSALAKKFKNFPSNREKEFLSYYNNIETLIKDKDIKYIRFIGKELMTEDEVKNVFQTRSMELDNKNLIKRRTDLTRYKTDTFDSCVVDQHNAYLLKPSFNNNLNDKFFKTRHYYKIFLKMMTKVLIQTRADQRLGMLQGMLKKNNIKNPVDFAHLMQNDWNDFFTKDVKSEESDIKIKFIQPKELFRDHLYNSNEINLNSLKQDVAHETFINLEELKGYDPLDRNDIEAMGYKEFKSNGMTFYEVTTDDKIIRSCAENENICRGERGDSEVAFDKISRVLEMPSSFKHHVETRMDTLLFNNPGLKKYAQYPDTTTNPSEGSIEYNLQPRHIPIDSLRYISSSYKEDIYKQLPLSLYNNIPIRELDDTVLVADSGFDYPMHRLTEADQRDLFIKAREKIDEDNYIYNLVKEDEGKIIESIEAGDEIMKGVRELSKEDIWDYRKNEKIKLENGLQAVKRQWMSTLPTILENYNSGISNPNNKFII